MPSYNRKVQLPGKSASELYDKISSDLDRFLTKASIGKFDIERDAGAKQFHIKSSMLTASLTCSDGNIELDGKLSLLAAPFKSKIDEGIDHWLKKHFNV